MAVCSFLGHRHIYGHDVQLRLQAAVNHLVEENDSVEFLLYLWKSTEPFYALCLLAALSVLILLRIICSFLRRLRRRRRFRCDRR